MKKHGDKFLPEIGSKLRIASRSGFSMGDCSQAASATPILASVVVKKVTGLGELFKYEEA